MTTHPQDPTQLAEWLDLDVEDALGPAERKSLVAALAADPQLAAERQRLVELRALLASGKVPVEPTFSLRVMAELPAAGWEARHPRYWAVAMAVAALLATASAVLLGIGSARLGPSLPFGAAAAAVLDLFVAGASAGAGLLGASWRGVGLMVGNLLQTSPAHLLVAAFGVGCLNLLVLQLLRRRSPVVAPHGARR